MSLLEHTSTDRFEHRFDRYFQLELRGISQSQSGVVAVRSSTMSRTRVYPLPTPNRFAPASLSIWINHLRGSVHSFCSNACRSVCRMSTRNIAASAPVADAGGVAATATCNCGRPSDNCAACISCDCTAAWAQKGAPVGLTSDCQRVGGGRASAMQHKARRGCAAGPACRSTRHTSCSRRGGECRVSLHPAYKLQSQGR